jgi:hypothetical protein
MHQATLILLPLVTGAGLRAERTAMIARRHRRPIRAGRTDYRKIPTMQPPPTNAAVGDLGTSANPSASADVAE